MDRKSPSKCPVGLSQQYPPPHTHTRAHTRKQTLPNTTSMSPHTSRSVFRRWSTQRVSRTGRTWVETASQTGHCTRCGTRWLERACRSHCQPPPHQQLHPLRHPHCWRLCQQHGCGCALLMPRVPHPRQQPHWVAAMSSLRGKRGPLGGDTAACRNQATNIINFAK
jgi:hypothetical protein